MTKPLTKTVIVERQASQKILLDLLSKQPSIGDTNFISLNVFLNSFKESNTDEDWFKCALALERLSAQGQIEIFKDILRFPITTDQVMSFMHTLAEEGWTLEDLPEGDVKSRELKTIVESVLPLFSAKANQWSILSSQDDLSSINVHEHFYAFPVQKRLDALQAKGLLIEPIKIQTPHIQVRFANNPRSEAQACVQHMLQDSLDYEDQAIVCLDPNLQDQLESFLIQYEVPYTRTHDAKTHPSFGLIQSLIKVKLDASPENLLDLIHNDCLDLKDKLSLVSYLELFKLDVKACLEPFDRVLRAKDNPYLGKMIRVSAYEKLEKEAEASIQGLRPVLQSLLSLETQDFSEFLKGLFDLYTSLHPTLDEDTIQAIQKVKGLIEAGHASLIKMTDPIPFLLYKLSKLTLSSRMRSGVIVTDLKHAFIPGLKRVYWLGCTQNNYPQVETHSGLFDEDYFKQIRGYEVKERYDYHMGRLEQLQQLSEEMIYSYPIGSYEGKAQKLPYDLEQKFESLKLKVEAWPLIETEAQVPSSPKAIPSDLAKALYFKDPILSGSISTFEHFFNCPYRYFLLSGLGIERPDNFALNNQVMGNLIHTVLEEGIRAYGKAYASVLLGPEAQHLKPYFEALKALFTAESASLDALYERSIELLSLSLRVLKDREEATEFKPIEVEYAFDEIKTLNDGKSIHFRGRVDRIDANANGFVVLDYKSSVKRLNESKVVSGLMLQLPTYLWILKDLLHKQPYGAYYFSFGQGSLKLEALKQVGTQAEAVYDRDVEWLKSRRMNGWTLEPVISLDFTGTHIVGVKAKGTTLGLTTQYDGDKIEAKMIELYTQMIQALENGDIRKQNLDGSCNYCDFSSFCQYKGPALKVPSTRKNPQLKKDKES